MTYKTTYKAIPCPCGHRTCKNWLVDPVAAVQSVSFTEAQAKAVATLLNDMEQNKRTPYQPTYTLRHFSGVNGPGDLIDHHLSLITLQSKAKDLLFNGDYIEWQYGPYPGTWYGRVNRTETKFCIIKDE